MFVITIENVTTPGDGIRCGESTGYMAFVYFINLIE
jgi:predicted RNA-binding protein with TRAM domain